VQVESAHRHETTRHVGLEQRPDTFSPVSDDVVELRGGTCVHQGGWPVAGEGTPDPTLGAAVPPFTFTVLCRSTAVARIP